jgi:ABC-type polysaccharide/polyol phosphate transport system ATPase subunit
MESFRSKGTTTLVVSHDLGLVESRCDRVALLDQGRLQALGSAADIVPLYRKQFLK